MKKIKKTSKGFTILELIVVAAIISLLASIILSRLDLSRAKARDAQKVSELKSLQNALELYYLDGTGYPGSASTDTGYYSNSPSDNTMTNILQPLVQAGYLSVIPTPPKGTPSGLDIYYYYTSDASGLLPSCEGKRLNQVPYIIFFVTELPSNLPKLSYAIANSTNLTPVNNGYCLTL